MKRRRQKVRQVIKRILGLYNTVTSVTLITYYSIIYIILYNLYNIFREGAVASAEARRSGGLSAPMP